MLKFFAEKMWVAFAVQKLLKFFQQKISEYCILNPLKAKLTMSLVNDSLKFTSSDTQICWKFLLKKCE